MASISNVLRPLPSGLISLCVKEAAVNKPGPVLSSSFLPPSPLGPPRVLGNDWNYTVMLPMDCCDQLFPREPLDCPAIV